MPVITDVVLKEPGEGKVYLRSVQRLKLGDFVLFREPGKRTVIEAVAEDMAGTEEYDRLRTLANAWRGPLREMGSAERAYRRLRGRGVRLSRAALRSWLRDDDRIGPQSPDHIRIIAECTGDGFLRSPGECCGSDSHGQTPSPRSGSPSDAAGVEGTSSEAPPSRRLGIKNPPDPRSAWVVQIEVIARAQEERPHWEVNQLLWADDS